MQCGLRNASATFQRNIKIILLGVKWSFCLCYLDDIIVFSSSFKQHFKNFDEVLENLPAANVQLKPSKFRFSRRSGQSLGHVISEGKLEMPHKKSASIQQQKPHSMKQQGRIVLGL